MILAIRQLLKEYSIRKQGNLAKASWPARYDAVISK